MGAVVAFVNQKGGVGKTTVTLGMASAARAAGQRVLVADLDPQGASTWVLGVDPDESAVSTAELLGTSRAGSAKEAVQVSAWGPEVDVLPATTRLHARETGTGKDPAGKLRLALHGVASHYDLVLLDCPPSLGNLTVNALSAADLAVIVAEPAALGLRGITAVADAVDEIWDRHNPGLDLAGVIVNRLPGVSAEAERRYEELGQIVGSKAVWKPAVPQRVIVPQAAADRRPIHSYGYRAHDVVEAFDLLWEHLRRAARRAQ
jgi:chromosome partitioning protein